MYKSLSFKYIILLTLPFLSCNNQEEKNQSKRTRTEGSAAEKYFGKNLAQLYQLEDWFVGQTAYSKSSKVEALQRHAASMRSDYFQKNPRNISFPYSVKSTFEKDIPQDIRYLIWNKDCSFTSTDSILTDYYCLNLDGPMIQFLQTSNDPYVKDWVNSLLQNKGFSTQMDQNNIVRSPDEADFNDLRHRMVYILHHLSIHFEQQARSSIKQ